MVNISNFFEKYGYTQGSVFATTYGPNGTVISGGDTVTCDYLRQVIQGNLHCYDVFILMFRFAN